MKRLAFTACLIVAMTMSSMQLYAKPGVVGGFTSSSLKINNFDVTNMSGFHIGVTYNLPLVAGLAIQPALLYNVKGASIEAGNSTLDNKMGFAEIPVQVQWGPDLLLFRAYGFVEPFIGYGVNAKSTYGSYSDVGDLNRFEYGVSIGFGAELWKLQVAIKYYWNLGDLYGDNPDTSIVSDLANAFTSKANFKGFALTVGIFF